MWTRERLMLALEDPRLEVRLARAARARWSAEAWGWIARHMPRQLRYAAFIAAAADATCDDRLARQVAPEVPLGDLLRVVHSREADGDRRPHRWPEGGAPTVLGPEGAGVPG